MLLALVALASAAFLSFMLGGWLLGIVLIRDIWKKQYVPATEPGSAPPRPRVAPGPHETELPESTGGAWEPSSLAASRTTSPRRPG
ncbi:MAG: hypothetical protein E6G55_01200 [Actinobacteria bacterium]|nr:MAG: hypothetical protein E6G55_01200 [Actinomycetota bacterium]